MKISGTFYRKSNPPIPFTMSALLGKWTFQWAIIGLMIIIIYITCTTSITIGKVESKTRFYRQLNNEWATQEELPEVYKSNGTEGICFDHIQCIKTVEGHFATPTDPMDMLTTFHLFNHGNFLGATVNYQNTPIYKTNIYGSVEKKEYYPFDLSAILSLGFDPALPTRIIIPGYLSTENEEWVVKLKNSYLHLNNENIILVYWPGGSRVLLYNTAASNTRIVGRQIVVFLYYLNQLVGPIDYSKVHLIGHSLGAQIAGFAGNDLDGQLARITALDPAGPKFSELERQFRLDKTDAKFVDVIHTSAGDLTITRNDIHFGMTEAVGHIDYYPNGGNQQPGCMGYAVLLGLDTSICDHKRAYELISNYLTELFKKEFATDQSRVFTKPVAYRYKVGQDMTRVNLLSVESYYSEQDDPDVDELPFRYELDFVKLSPTNFPTNHREPNATYYFKTNSDIPYFGPQYMLRLQMDTTPNRSTPYEIVVKFQNDIVFQQKVKLEPITDLLFIENKRVFEDLVPEDVCMTLCVNTLEMFNFKSPTNVQFSSAHVYFLDSNINVEGLEFVYNEEEKITVQENTCVMMEASRLMRKSFIDLSSS